jgi:hypothetical protein
LSRFMTGGGGRDGKLMLPRMARHCTTGVADAVLVTGSSTLV